MAYIKFRKPDEPSIKSIAPRGRKFKKLFISILILFIIENGYLAYLYFKH